MKSRNTLSPNPLKNWEDLVLHHMLDSKKKNMNLPYAKLITKILTYTDYNFGEEYSEFMHTKIGQAIVSRMGYAFQAK